MNPTNGVGQIIPSLADRLRQVRSRRFIGRAAELDQFRSALEAAEIPFLVYFLNGPGGVGKTSLLQEFAAICAELGIPHFWIDGRDIQPSTETFMDALHQAINLPPADSLLSGIGAIGERRVIFIDNYERLQGLDRWLRSRLLPQLPDNTLTVIAGRNPPSTGWRADAGWQALVESVSIRNFSPAESRLFLTGRGVPEGQHDTVLRFTHGYPLALSLIADLFTQSPSLEFRSEKEPDIIKSLLDRLVRQIPGPQHRAALQACSLVRQTSEQLLAFMLAADDAHDLFEWLRRLSFIEAGDHGIFPHDLAREAIASDLRWRNRERYAELHGRARSYYKQQLQKTGLHDQQRVLIDYVFLHRDNPIVQPVIEHIQSGGARVGSFLPDNATESDLPHLFAMTARFEGQDSADLLAYWFSRQRERFLVFRTADGDPAGFMLSLALESTSPDDRRQDPALARVWDYLQTHAPLRPGERATHYRFWMAADTYQSFSIIQGLIAVNTVRHQLTTPGLAFTFFPVADPALWQVIFSYADLHRLPEADYTIGGKTFGVFGHDWRIVPPTAWLDLLAKRELASTPQTAPRSRATEPVLVLSAPEFAEAVKDALRYLTQPDMLAQNPLLRSRLVLNRAGTESEPAGRVSHLQEIILETAGQLQASPREIKYYRTLYHTYIRPAVTQAQAAEILDLPHGTYRRHLRRGIERLTELLWQQEIGAGKI